MTHNYIDGILTITREDGAELKYAYNPETQQQFNSEQEALDYAHSRPMHFILPPTLEELQTVKVLEIDTATKTAIITLAGDATAQSNKLAKSSQLIRKESLGTITTDEALVLTHLDDMFVQVENLIATGNDNEAQIMSCTTIAEYEALCVTLGV